MEKINVWRKNPTKHDSLSSNFDKSVMGMVADHQQRACWSVWAVGHPCDRVTLDLPWDFKTSLRKLPIMWLVVLLFPVRRLSG